MTRPEKIEFILVSVFIGLLILGLVLLFFSKTIRGELERADIMKFEGMRPPTAALPISILHLRGKVTYRPKDAMDWTYVTDRTILSKGAEIAGNITFAIENKAVVDIEDGSVTLQELSLKEEKLRMLLNLHSGSVTVASSDEQGQVEITTALATYLVTGRAVLKVSFVEGRSQVEVLRGFVQMITKDGRVWEIHSGNAATVVEKVPDRIDQPVHLEVQVRKITWPERRRLVTFASKSRDFLEEAVEPDVAIREEIANQIAELKNIVEFCRVKLDEKKIEECIHYAADPFTFQDEILTHVDIIRKFYSYADRFCPLRFFVDEEKLRVELDPEVGGAMVVVSGRAIGKEICTDIVKEKKGVLYVWLEKKEGMWVAQWAIFEDAMWKRGTGGK